MNKWPHCCIGKISNIKTSDDNKSNSYDILEYYIVFDVVNSQQKEKTQYLC